MNRRNSIKRLAVLAGLAPVAAHAQASTNDPDITGAWYLTTTPDPIPGVPAELQPQAFSEIMTFAQGGAMTETNTLVHTSSYVPGNPLPTNVNGSDGFGSWKKSGANSIEVAFIKMLYNQSGRHIGFLRVLSKLTVENGKMRGPSQVEFQFTDPQMPPLPGSTNSEGNRIEP